MNTENMFQEINDLRIAGRSGEEEKKGIAQKFPEQEFVVPPIS